MKLNFFVGILLVMLLGAVTTHVQCDENLVIPAVTKFIHNIRNVSNTNPEIVTFRNAVNDICSHCPSCTACLSCCLVKDVMKEKEEEETLKTENLVGAMDQLNWNCPCTACPLTCAVRKSVQKKMEVRTKQIVTKLNLQNPKQGTVDMAVKTVVEGYMAQMTQGNDAVKQEDTLDTFFDKMVNCPCTACPLQCFYRKLMK